MAHDREVLRMIWEGQIGICFQADRDEIVGIKPEPFYLMISRLSYLPLVTDKVRNKINAGYIINLLFAWAGAKVLFTLHIRRASRWRCVVRF